MSILFIIIILLVIVGLALVFRLIKNVFKAAIYFFVLIAIILFLGGIFVYSDAADFKSKIANSSLTFIAVENNKILAGVKVIDMKKSDIVLLSQETIAQYQEAYKKENYDIIKGDSYKIFTFNLSSLKSLNETLTYQNYALDSTVAVTLLQSATPIDDAAAYIANSTSYRAAVKQKLVDDFKTDQQFKDAIFSMFIAKLFPAKTLYIVEHIKTKEISIYPETAMFKAVQFVPTSWLSNALQRGGQNQSQVLEKKG